LKVLLDHCIDRRLARHLAAHECSTASQLGWAALRNGALLAIAAKAGFEVMVTTDANLKHEQNLESLPLAVVVLRARSNRLSDLVPLVGPLLELLARPLGNSLREIEGA
jgi:predicted nuclease of predicted toxin-antitoxin system